MAAWFGSPKGKKDKSDAPSENDAARHDEHAESELITISDVAMEKINLLINNAASPVLGIRVLAEATSPVNPEYSLAFVQEGEDFDDDTILAFDQFNVYIDADSLPHVQNVRLDFVTAGAGGGFRIDKIAAQKKIEGPVAEKLQQVINEQINPALALHGGFVQLIDVKDATAYIELGGGCKGCGMVDVTLKQGIEVMIKQHVPEIVNVLDTTDHNSGQNPYYQPSK